MTSPRKAAHCPEDASRQEGQIRILVWVVWAGLFLVHANKAIGFYPIAIPDEYWYTSDLRHRVWSDTAYPNYIQYLLYSVTNLFQYRFLDAGRVLNAFFFMLSAPFLFRISRLVCGKNAAYLLTLLVLVSPISSFTMFFMPESLYFTAFWALAWLLLCRTASLPPFRAGAVFGAGVAVLSMIKMHGLFVLPGYAFYILLTTRGQDRTGQRTAYLKKVGATAGGLVCAFLVVRLAAGFAIAGVNGLNPLGSYADLAAGGTQGADVWVLAEGVLRTLFGHAAALAVLFGLPMVFSLKYLTANRTTDSNDPLRRLILFAWCFLLPLLCVTAGISSLFTATRDVFETASINWRYYNFLFPAFPIIVAGVMTRIDLKNRMPGVAVALTYAVPALLCLYAGVTGFYGYFFLMLGSNPELGGLTVFGPLFRIGAVAAAAVLIAAMFAPRAAGKCHVCCLLPALCLLATAGVQLEATATASLPQLLDKGGIFARDHLGERCADLTVIDAFYGDMGRALLHIDNPGADMLAQFTPEVDMTQVKPGKKWLLVFGGIEVPKQFIKSEIEYIDPAQTPELTARMRLAGNLTSMMLRYTLVELADG